MFTAPCLDCKERKILIGHGIYCCHSFCKLYQEYNKTREKARERKRQEGAMKHIMSEGYKRTTRGQYQKYKK